MGRDPNRDRGDRRLRRHLPDHLADLLGRPEGPHALALGLAGRALLRGWSPRRGNYIFPLYLNNVSDLHRIGGTIGFILVALVWFYAISLVMLAGAVINSLRHEQDDTGSLPMTAAATGSCASLRSDDEAVYP